MGNRSDSDAAGGELRERLIGLGEHSHRKSYYPELQMRLEELERFRAFLDYSHDAIFLVEVPNGTVVDFNDSAARQSGWNAAELAGRSIFSVFELAEDEFAKQLICADGPLDRQRARVETRLCRRIGTAVPAELTLARMTFQQSAYVIVVARDVSKRKAAEAALAERVRLAELGAEIGAALTTGKDLADTLQRCAESLVRHLRAAFGRIWVVSRQDPELLELQGSAGRYPRRDGRHSRKRFGELKVGEIAKSGTPYLTNEVIGDPGFSDQEWARSEGMVAFAGYPLVVNGRTVGVIALFFQQAMTEAVLGTLASVADEIAVGIVRQRAEIALGESERRRLRLQTQLEFAAQVQARLLPTDPPQLPGFEVAARCRPAYQVGGDFYDWQETEAGYFSLTLGDVMGKGPAAAMLMATVRASLRAVAQRSPPAEALRQAERALRQDLNNAESFVTLFHARLDSATRRMSYVDCGHGFVLMRRADGSVEELLPRGLPFGVLAGDSFQEGDVVFRRGDCLVLFSDGLMEALQGTELDNAALARKLWAESPRQMVERLTEIMPSTALPPDDMTLVVVKCTTDGDTG
jgi:PAS domain S-box-containing protein